MNIKSIIHVFQAVVLTAVVVVIGSAWATEYSLTARVQCEEKGINGLPSGKRMCDLLSTDILNVTKSNGQMYFCGSSSTTYNVNCPITVKGNGKDGEATGKFRMQLSSGYTVNINGVVTMTGDTVVSAHTNGQNWGNLKFNNQITGSASLIIAPGNKTPTYLNNATANKNNYTGNTQIGASGLYQSNAGGYLYLAQDEQIPDVSTNGTSCKGNLVLANSSTLNLNGHKETINGISSDTGSVITGDSNSTLTVGANNSTSTYSGNLTGSMNLTKIGTGTLKIGANRTKTTGELTVNGGTLTMFTDADQCYPSITKVNVNNGSTFSFERSSGKYGQIWFNSNQVFSFDENGGGTISTLDSNLNLVVNSNVSMTTNGGATNKFTGNNGFNLNSGGITFNVADGTSTNNEDLVVSAKIWNNGYVAKSGAGTLVISNSGNSYAGGTTIKEGTLKVTGSGTLGSGTVTVNSGTTLNYENTNGQTVGNTITGAGTLLKSGTGTIKIGSSKTQLSNNITVTGGTLTMYTDADTSTFSPASVNINGASTFGFEYSSGRYGQIWFNNNQTFTFDETGGGTINTNNSGLNLVVNSNVSVTTNGGATDNIIGSIGFNLNSGGITFNVADGTSTSNEDLVVSARLWNGGKVVKNGAGTMVLSNGNNSYAGGTTINAGTIKTNNATLGTGAISMAVGTTLEYYDTTSSRSLSNTVTGSGTIKFTGNGTNNSHYDMQNSNLSTFAGNVVIDGARVLVKETQDIGNTTTNTNIDIKTGGQLYLPGGSVTANFTIAGTGTTEGLGAIRIDGATLNGNVTLSGDASIRNYLGGNSTVNSKIDLAGHTLTLGLSYNANKTVLNGAISDSSTGTKGSVVYATRADSWFDVAGANTYSGGTTLQSGIIYAYTDKAFGTGTVTLSGGTLSQVNARTFANNIDVTANTSSVIKTNSYDMTLTGNWSGSGTVTRTGNTKLKITGDLSAFTGTLITTEGDLYLTNKSFGSGTLSMRGNSTLSSAVNVPTGATLDLARTSNTTINNTYTFEAGSTLSVGSNTTVNTDVSLAGTSIRVATGTSLVKSDNSDWNHTVVSGQTYTKGSSVFSNTTNDMKVTGTDLGGNTTLNLSGGTLTLGTSDQIPVTTGIKAQFDSASTGSIQTNANGTVATWFDSSGNNYNATLKQGTITKTSLNGNTTLDFDNGGTTYLSFNRISGIKTVFWVVKDGNGQSNEFLLGDDSAYNFHRGDGGQIWHTSYAVPVTSGGTTLIDGTQINNSNPPVLNQQWYLISTKTSTSMQANAISMDRAGSCGARSWTGEMGEILIFNQELTDAQITELGIYLQNKWGLNSTYKNLFYSPTTALNVTADTTVDTGDYTSITFGTATLADGKTLSIDVKENKTTAWSGAFSGTGTMEKTGDGTLRIYSSNISDLKGDITVDNGTLVLNANSGIDFYVKNININNGSTLTMERPNTDYRWLYYRTSTSINFDENGGGTLNTGTLTDLDHYINNVIYNPLLVTTNGGETNYLTGSNGFNLDSANITFNVVKGNETSVDGDLNVSARIWNHRGITKTGDGTLVLSYSGNDYEGGTDIQEGTLIMTHSNALGTGTISIAEDALLHVSNVNFQRTATVSGAGTMEFSGTTSTAFLTTGTQSGFTGKIVVDPSKTLLVCGYSGSNEIVANDDLPYATLELGSKSNLVVNRSSSWASTLNVKTLNSTDADSVIRANDNDAKNYIPSLTVGSGSYAGNIGVDGNANKNLLHLIKASDGSEDGGTWTLSGNHYYTGGTEIKAGTLKLTGNATLGTGKVVNSGTLEFAPATNESMRFSNEISGGTLLKSDEGTLYVNTSKNPISSTSFDVKTGNLMYQGKYTGKMSLYEGSLMSPGNSVGTLTIAGGLDVKSGSTLLFEQDATGMDQLILETGTALSIDKNAILELTMGEAISGATYLIVDSADQFTGDSASSSFWNSLLSAGSNYFWNLSVVDGNKVYAQIDPNAVPEPSTWALLILGFAGLMWLKRSEKR